ncbi:MAG: hypothetical protein U1F68_09760, partial [Gammaproteobacteria bacterium]
LYLQPDDDVGGNAYEPVLAVGPGDSQHVLYREFVPVGSPVSGRFAIVYGACPTDCTVKTHWRFIELDQNAGSSGGNPRLQIATDGSVHAAWYRETGTLNFDIVYARCPADCASSASNWASTDVRGDLLQGRASGYFKLDPQHRPRLIVDGLSTAYYLACDGACADPARWQATPMLTHSATLDPAPSHFALAFTGAGLPRIAYATQANTTDGTLHYTECNGNCSNPANWTDTPLYRLNIPSFDLAVDPTGRPRLAFYQGGPGSGLAERLFYGWCDGNCNNAAQWRSADTGAPAEHGSGGVNVVFDSQGTPWIGYGFRSVQGYLRCTSGCAASPLWERAVIETSDDVARTDPPPFNWQCPDPNHSSFWLLNFPPTLGFNASGKLSAVYNIWNGETCGIFSRTGPAGLRYAQIGVPGNTPPAIFRDDFE